jgi:hypothetical protein
MRFQAPRKRYVTSAFSPMVLEIVGDTKRVVFKPEGRRQGLFSLMATAAEIRKHGVVKMVSFMKDKIGLAEDYS